MPPAAAVAPLTSSHVVVLVMENEEYGSVIGSRDAPFVNSLARRYAQFTSFHGVRHPSLPNYLALLGGSTFGIDSDCTDCSRSAPTLLDQLDRAGLSWKGYMESMPRPCYGGADAGEYAKKHNPFMYFRLHLDNPARCAKVVPASALAGGPARRGGCPRSRCSRPTSATTRTTAPCAPATLPARGWCPRCCAASGRAASWC